jgi:hypothetical protein
MAQDAGTTQGLYNRCVRNDPICGGYLMGVGSVLIMMGKAYQEPALDHNFMAPFQIWAICPTHGPVNGNSLRHRFLAWVEENPTNRPAPMLDSAMTAFKEAWPCAEKSN